MKGRAELSGLRARGLNSPLVPREGAHSLSYPLAQVWGRKELESGWQTSELELDYCSKCFQILPSDILACDKMYLSEIQI